MNEIVERVENNLINIYNKFDILDKKLNNYHMKFHKINEMIDIIISDEYTLIHKKYSPVKNFDLQYDRFFIYNAVIDILLKKIVILSLNIFLSLNVLIFLWLLI